MHLNNFVFLSIFEFYFQLLKHFKEHSGQYSARPYSSPRHLRLVPAICTTLMASSTTIRGSLDLVREPVARLLLHTARPCGLVHRAQLVNSSQPNPHNSSHGFLFSPCSRVPLSCCRVSSMADSATCSVLLSLLCSS